MGRCQDLNMIARCNDYELILYNTSCLVEAAMHNQTNLDAKCKPTNLNEISNKIKK